MKFFKFILISSSLTQYWVYLDGAPSILVPSHLLYSPYSIHQSLQPRNADPNIVSSTQEIPVEDDEKYDLSISLPIYSYSKRENILHECERDLCSQHPLIYEHSLCYKFELSSHDNELEYHLLIHDNGTLSPKLYEPSYDLRYVNSCDILPYCKSMKFIETKVSAMKLQGFNH